MRYLLIFVILIFQSLLANAEESIFNNLNTKLDTNKSLTYNYLSKHITKFEYFSWINDKDFESYLSYENDPEELSPGPAVILFFHNEILYAVLHTGQVKSYRFVASEKVSGYHMEFLQNNNNTLVSKFKQKYYNIIRNAD